MMSSELENNTGQYYSLLCFYQDTNLLYKNDIENPFYPGCWVRIVTSVNVEYRDLSARLWPNPAGGIINTNLNIGRLRTYNIYGQDVTTKVQRSGRNMLDIENLVPGIYLLITDDEPEAPMRFIKE